MKSILARIEELTLSHDRLTPEIIKEKNVKPGLRNADGSGVVVGLTTKGRVVGYEKKANNKDKNKFTVKPCEGRLYYCGYDVEKLIDEIDSEKAFGFDEVVYLLLSGELPGKKDLCRFTEELAKRRALSSFERRIIMEEFQNENQMYWLHGVISHMTRGDAKADSLDIKDVTRQCLNLIAKAPTIVAYNYNVKQYRKGADLQVLRPKPELSTAANFLYMLKGVVPSDVEARLFDISMILHAEHGGGNNSTFTVRTVSSSGANTYMAIAAGIASLSGHLHGGANEAVMDMMKDLKKNIKDWKNEREIKSYFKAVLNKKKGDGSGKIFGFGHAVYTLSDPRATIFKSYLEEFAKMKGATEEFHLYEKVGKIAKDLLEERKGSVICPNVDFYSGFVYKLLGIPKELYTPIFAMSRMAGWSAHRLEQIIQGKIIRPAYVTSSVEELKYVPLDKR